MPIFPVYDSFHSHPKALVPSLTAIGLWTMAGSWSNNHLTDGFVPDHAAQLLSRGQVELAKELVAAGLWKRVRGGFQFHQWTEDGTGATRNLTRQEAMNKRSKMASGGSLGNHRRWHVNEGIRKADCPFCQGEYPRPPDRVPDQYPESGGDSGANPINQSVFKPPHLPVVDQRADSQSVRAQARAHEAIRWLTADYPDLTDDEAHSSWIEAERKANGKIKHVVPYLKRMQDRGDLADIIKAVQAAAEHHEQPPAPELYAVPDPLVHEPESADRPPAMPRDQSRAFAHLSTCKAVRCPRCVDIADRWPDLKRSGT